MDHQFVAGSPHEGGIWDGSKVPDLIATVECVSGVYDYYDATVNRYTYV